MSFPSFDIVNFAIFKQKPMPPSSDSSPRHHPSVHHWITPYIAERSSFPVWHSTFIGCLRTHRRACHQRLLASFHNLHIWCCAVLIKRVSCFDVNNPTELYITFNNKDSWNQELKSIQKKWIPRNPCWNPMESRNRAVLTQNVTPLCSISIIAVTSPTEYYWGLKTGASIFVQWNKSSWRLFLVRSLIPLLHYTVTYSYACCWLCVFWLCVVDELKLLAITIVRIKCTVDPQLSQRDNH